MFSWSYNNSVSYYKKQYGGKIMKKVFTVKEYVPDYLGLKGYYITYNLNDMTITVDGKTKKMSEYRYKKALEYLNKQECKQ